MANLGRMKEDQNKAFGENQTMLGDKTHHTLPKDSIISEQNPNPIKPIIIRDS